MIVNPYTNHNVCFRVCLFPTPTTSEAVAKLREERAIAEVWRALNALAYMDAFA